MRRLILLRHAKTERDAPSGRDVDRSLDERGMLDAQTVGQWLARNGYRPEVALVSPATRAIQTWDTLARSLSSTRMKNVDQLYNADAGDLLTIIHGEEIDDPKLLMVVAHNPALHELALALIAAGETAGLRAIAANMPTAGVAVINFEIESWGDAGFRKGTLERFVSPKLLKEWSDNKLGS